MKNKFLLIIVAMALCTSAVQAQKAIVVQNKTDENRVELLSIPYAKFSKHFRVDSVFTIKDKAAGTVVPHQLERLGTANIQNVLIQVQVAGESELELTVSKEQAPAFTAKAYARYVPERYDDFAWENDVVAFRMYGKALEGRADDAQGIDYWAKRTSNLVIDKWYKTGDYHRDHGEGQDYYSVGQTLGVGDIAPFFEDEIQYTKHYRQYQVLDNGPLRTTFRLSYEPQTIAGNTISMTKTISLDAGQQFNKIVLALTNETQSGTPIVIGVANRGESEPKVEFDAEKRFLAYWEPAIKDFGMTGTAVLAPDSKITFLPNAAGQFLLKTEVKNNKPLVYYNGAAWNKAGKFTDAEAWRDAVSDFADALKKPLKVKLK